MASELSKLSQELPPGCEAGPPHRSCVAERTVVAAVGIGQGKGPRGLSIAYTRLGRPRFGLTRIWQLCGSFGPKIRRHFIISTQSNYAEPSKLSPEFRNRFIGSGISCFFESGAVTEKSG